MSLGELTLPKTHPNSQGPALDLLQQVSHALDREEDPVVGWHHNTLCQKLAGQGVTVGKGLFSRSCLYPTKSALTHWFPSVLHSLSKPKALNAVHRPTDSIAFPPWAKSSLLNKKCCSHRSHFLPANFTLETLVNVTQAKQREFISFWG